MEKEAGTRTATRRRIAFSVLAAVLAIVPGRAAQSQVSQLFDSSIPSELVGEVIANDGLGNLEVRYEAARGVGSTSERTVRIDMTEASFVQYPVTIYSTNSSCIQQNTSPYLVGFDDVKDLTPNTASITGWSPFRFDPNRGEFFAAHVVSWRRFTANAPFQLALMGTESNTQPSYTARAVLTAQGTCDVLPAPITFVNNVEVVPLLFTAALQEDGELEPQFVAPYQVDNPILDTDGDGIPDDVDICPDSPPSVLVNQDGCTELEVCSLDLLGAQDQLSACEAELSTVDRFVDTDRDGEEDRTDRCPGTEALAAVDDSGCSLGQFCVQFDVATQQGNLACRSADWQNDEPVGGLARDCRVDRDDGFACVPELP